MLWNKWGKLFAFLFFCSLLAYIIFLREKKKGNLTSWYLISKEGRGKVNKIMNNYSQSSIKIQSRLGQSKPAIYILTTKTNLWIGLYKGGQYDNYKIKSMYQCFTGRNKWNTVTPSKNLKSIYYLFTKHQAWGRIQQWGWGATVLLSGAHAECSVKDRGCDN